MNKELHEIFVSITRVQYELKRLKDQVNREIDSLDKCLNDVLKQLQDVDFKFR